MAWTAQEYLDRMAQTRSAHLKNIDTTGKRIRGIYAQAAKDLAKRAALAKDGSLTKRWQEDYQKALEQRVAQMRIELGNTVTGAMRKSARLPGETIEGWLDDALAMCGAEGSFSGVFSRTPDEALRSLLDGRMYRDGKSLSRRIWHLTDQLQGNIEEIVAQGIAQKRSALNIARDLEAYVNPKAKMPVSWLGLYPDIPFDRQIDYNAQRLARTAINHAYWAANVETALQNPFCTAIHWQLSPSHYERQVARFGEDVCDTYASHDEGLGRGNYPIKNVPMPHAQCLCAQYQVVPELDDVADRLSKWVDGGADSALDEAFGAWKLEQMPARRAASAMNRVAAPYSMPMNRQQRDKIIRGIEAKGTQVWMDDEAEAYLDSRSEEVGTYIEGSNFGEELIILRKNASASAVFEELIHWGQNRHGEIDGTPESICRAEIAAAEKLLKNQAAYGITEVEAEYTRKRLKAERERLQNLMEGGV